MRGKGGYIYRERKEKERAGGKDTRKRKVGGREKQQGEIPKEN